MSSSLSTQVQALDDLTGGAFSAPTSGERAARLRQWLSTDPAPERLQEVFKELSARDKGAARVLRERLDELRRSRDQASIAAEWAARAEALLAQAKLNIADALAWQRDAAKAGAPLSREPLAALKASLADRVKAIEDLQHRVQVQREAAVLLAQRIEVLSTKSWKDAVGAAAALQADVPAWQAQAEALVQDAAWPSVDARFPPQLEASRAQLQAVWDAFQTALAQAQAAESDPAAPLPLVPVWADELRVARGLPPEPAAAPARAPKAPVDPQRKAQAEAAVRGAIERLEKEVAEGHGKASTGAAGALRQALKEHGRLVDAALDQQAHAALAAAGELEGWQRWRTDQLRQELVTKAEGLFEDVAAPGSPTKPAKPARPAKAAAPAAAASDAPVTESPATSAAASPAAESIPMPAAEAAAPADAAPAAATQRRPRFGGRKMQEELRSLREQWKQLDKGAAPNHALWKRFDEACNRAYAVVEEWLHKVKAESAEHRTKRLALIEEVQAWTTAQAGQDAPDWKAQVRALHQFESRWREAGHLSEKAFAELQPQWRQVLHAAHAPLAEAQKQSLARRQALIAEAEALGAAPQLRIDAVKALQQRWQAEAHTVPLDRRQEQKLWDAFRKPIDEAFARKGQARDTANAALSERDRAVLEASKAVEAANASGDAKRIRDALAALEAALRGQAQARAEQAAASAAAAEAGAGTAGATSGESAAAPASDGATPASGEATASDDASGDAVKEGEAGAAKAPAPKAAPRPVVAMRGDDRPGMKRAEPQPAGRGGRPGERGAGGRFGADRGREGGREGGRFGRDARDSREDRGPRLGDAAFRAQRDAVEHAQATLRKLAAQAHGEALVQLLSAWEQRDAEQVPAQGALGRSVSPAVRGSWVQALSAAPSGDAAEALLRLEIAAEVPTPAEQLSARRMLQLQLLTRRNDPAPAETWGQDTAKVLASAHQPQAARRLQNVLKALMR